MNDQQWRRLRTLFAETQEMPEPERPAFLDRELADDPDLRAELDRLLASSNSASEFLHSGDADFDLGTIGPYRLIRLLGEGGFGVVYLAEQLRPIRRRVALKLIKPGMDTRQVIARFEAERQALAVMDHPGIARVFDAGETSEGRPYFVMEYVPGTPITHFADQHRLSFRDRLELFLEVCGAVQHAHQKGLIHRDIKPGNILVAEGEAAGAPQPKIIDFGIAKATGADASRTLATREGIVVGTLGSMSPEQAGAIEVTVDTRSDIYSLGVVLYELLAGYAPFDAARLRQGTWTEAVRVIREEEPPSLAARVMQSSDAAAIAERRRMEPRGLVRELGGELEWITRRAIEKEPDRRYATASELAADIRRHLAHEPVLAGAPSTMYRLSKYARRHRVGVAASAIVLAAIVAGGIATGLALQRALAAERVARREAESATRVTDFLAELFESPTPDRSLGQTVTARTLLDVGARRIQGEKIPDPKVRARLLSTVGSAYSSLGLNDEGLALLDEAAEEMRVASGEQSVDYAKSLTRNAELLRIAARYAEAESTIARSLEILSAAPPANPVELASAIRCMSEVRLNQGGTVEADSLIDISIAILEGQAPADTTALIAAYTTKGNVAAASFELDEQLKHHTLALELATARYGEQNSRVLLLHRSLTRLSVRRNDPEGAMEHATIALNLARKMYPEGHPVLASALTARGEALMSAGKWSEAAADFEEGMAIYRASYGDDHPILANPMVFLARTHEGAGQLNLAVASWRDCCALRSKIYGPTTPLTAEVQTHLARLLVSTGETSEADSLYRTAIPRMDPGRPSAIAFALTGHANLCRSARRWVQADSLYVRAESLYDTTSADQRFFYGECRTNHAYMRSLQGRHADAVAMMQAGTAMMLEGDSPEDPELVPMYVLSAATRAEAGQLDAAIESLKLAASCGATTKDAAPYPALAALQTRDDYPLALAQ